MFFGNRVAYTEIQNEKDKKKKEKKTELNIEQ